MNSELTDILDGLPDDERKQPEAALGEILRELAGKSVPGHRALRIWSLGTLQVRLMSRKLICAIEQSFIQDHERKAMAKHRTALAAAHDVFKTMGYLRGAVAKAGQALAAWPRVAPDQVCELLDALHFQAPPMHYSLIEAQLENELGAPPDEIFAEFETEAFAAASIGQVHMARLKTGEKVAVKVQYPGIARTITSDIKNLKTLIFPLRLTKDGDNHIAKLDDIHETLTREADYEAEARTTRKIAEIFADDDDIVIPTVFEDYSTSKVLVTEYIDGDHVAGYMDRQPSQAKIDSAAAKFFGATSRMFYGARMVWSDPSPGNVIFLRDGRVALIDFGCCYEFSPGDWSLIERGTQEFVSEHKVSHEVMAEGMDLDMESYLSRGDAVQIVHEFTDWTWEPILTDGPFAVDEKYMMRGIEMLKEITSRKLTRSMTFNTWTNRLFLGARSLLFRMGSTANLKTPHDRELRRAGF